MFQDRLSNQEDAVKSFLARYADRVLGCLRGFDRVVFRGTLRGISFPEGLMSLLWKRQVLLKNFDGFARELTEQVKRAVFAEAERLGRPNQYIASSRTSKEQVAREIAERDGIEEGLIAVLRCVEPCSTFDVFRDREHKRLRLVNRIRKCLFVYRYWIDPVFGFMSARIQTWLPFSIQICINGREWLARQMDQSGMAYRRLENCFPWIEDFDAAQRLMDKQLEVAWPEVLRDVARRLNPEHETLFHDLPTDYYWSAYQTEWASDVVFKTPELLAEIYPALVLHGVTTFRSPDVMRFLGKRVRCNFEGEIISNFRERPEGVRIKHWLDGNSIKLYDKFGVILRPETTINNPSCFRVYRPREGDPDGTKTWRVLRRGVADLHRRAQVSEACNDRYLSALAEVDTSIPIGRLAAKVCRPVKWRGQRVRALRPWADDDQALLEAMARGEFAINGFRNRDLRTLLYPDPPTTPAERRRQTARVSRLIRLLRAHGLVRRVSRTYRYTLTPSAHQLIPAILTTQRVSLQQLQKVA